jgi:hypothetical protein
MPQTGENQLVDFALGNQIGVAFEGARGHFIRDAAG